MSAFQQSKQQQNALRGPIPSLYVQDTYHASPRLTLVAGVRWAPNFMPVDYFNRGTIFNMADFLSNTVSSVYPNAPAGILFYGDKGVPRAFTKNSPWQFSPNVGASFDPVGDGKVIRAGGAWLDLRQANFFTGQRNQQNPPFATAIANTQTFPRAPGASPRRWSVGLCYQPAPSPARRIPTPADGAVLSSVAVHRYGHPVPPPPTPSSGPSAFSISSVRAGRPRLEYIGNPPARSAWALLLSPAVSIPGVWGASGAGCAGIVRTGPAAVTPGAAGTHCSTTKNQASRFALTIENPAEGNQFFGAAAAVRPRSSWRHGQL